MAAKQYTISSYNTRTGSTYGPYTGTIDELIEDFHYTLEKGKSWEHERGNKKINMNPRTGANLVKQLNNAATNSSMNGAPAITYELL